MAKEALISKINYEDRRKNLPENTGMKWSKDEENKLIAAFDAGTEIKDIAKQHMRTKGAITSRLVRLGKIERE